MITLHDINKAIHKDEYVWQKSRSCKLLKKAFDVIQELSLHYKKDASTTYLFDLAEAYNDLSWEEFCEFCADFEYTSQEVKVAISEEIGDDYTTWIYETQK